MMASPGLDDDGGGGGLVWNAAESLASGLGGAMGWLGYGWSTGGEESANASSAANTLRAGNGDGGDTTIPGPPSGPPPPLARPANGVAEWSAPPTGAAAPGAMPAPSDDTVGSSHSGASSGMVASACTKGSLALAPMKRRRVLGAMALGLALVTAVIVGAIVGGASSGRSSGSGSGNDESGQLLLQGASVPGEATEDSYPSNSETDGGGGATDATSLRPTDRPSARPTAPAPAPAPAPAASFSFYVMGDVPYNPIQAKTVQDQILHLAEDVGDRDLFLVHVGDAMNAKLGCKEEDFVFTRDLLTLGLPNLPAFILPGDK